MHHLPAGAGSAARDASVFRPGLFEGAIVMVTGGSSSLGRCTAHELASLGARLALVGRKPEKLEATRDELARIYPEAADRITLHACDIRVETGVPNARHSWTLPPAKRGQTYDGFPQYAPPSLFSAD